jgi:hypothetical protein
MCTEIMIMLNITLFIMHVQVCQGNGKYYKFI